MNVEERLNYAGFKKVNKDNETCCALCNYYTVTDDTHEDACELHRVNFGKNFDAWGHECGAVDCSKWNNIVNGILEEQKEEEKLYLLVRSRNHSSRHSNHLRKKAVI